MPGFAIPKPPKPVSQPRQMTKMSGSSRQMGRLSTSSRQMGRITEPSVPPSRKLQVFKKGGKVKGPKGKPQLAIVEGGEKVIPVKKRK